MEDWADNSEPESLEVRCTNFILKTFSHFSQQVEKEVNDPETQEDAQQVECLDMEALPSGSNQVKTTV